MPACLIALGANTGNREAQIGAAISEIAGLPETQVIQLSSPVETPPVGRPDLPFLNGCALIDSGLEPRRLLAALLDIERRGGRTRHPRAQAAGAGNRPIDLDLLIYGEVMLSEAATVIPHPRMSFRRFVLQPAAEIAAELNHPLLGNSIGGLLECLDQRENRIAVRGPVAAGEPVPRGAEHGPWQIDWINSSARPEKLAAGKLLIEACAPSVSRAELWSPEYHGPRWQTGIVDPAEFSRRVATLIDEAIQSMEKLAR